MGLEAIENIVMLLSAILALLSALFKYIEVQKRGWLYIAAFFLADILSSYYWATYTLVMGANPDVSAFIAYFGWNLGFLILLIAVLSMQSEGARQYFHPLMLLPVPVNVYLFTVFIQFGGVLNNTWQGCILTMVSCVCLRTILYYFKNRKSGVHFPYFHTAVFLYVTLSYGMWTASCYDWPSDAANPYYYCVFASYILQFFFAWAAGKDYEAEGLEYHEKSSSEMRLQMLLRVLVLLILVGGCFGGIYLARWMKGTMPEGTEYEKVYNVIAITLFIISVFIVLLICAVVSIMVFGFRIREKEGHAAAPVTVKRSRNNLIITLLITLGLIVFVVSYTSRLFYNVSLTGIMSTGEDKAHSVSTELENYLVVAESSLEVVADTVGLMIQNNESRETICGYIVDQTTNLKDTFDENFTGLYAYVDGEYMDGLEWVPPDDYVPTDRDWYKQAVQGGGETIICEPYLDAQTGSIVITICRMLSDGKNVVALDVIVDHIQKITDEIDLNGKGYGMIVDNDDIIVAYPGREYNGESFTGIFGKELFDRVIATDRGGFNAVVGGEDSTVFVSLVMEQWYVVIVVSDRELFSELYDQLTVSVIVFLVIYALLSFFYYLGYKNEQAYGKKVEEMRAGRQKQEYEAQVLKLEKLAADEANKAKSSFLADMSHEIRTPINAIMGMNEMILREAEVSAVRDYAQNIQTSGKTLLQLINSILDFSKIEDGKMEIVPVRYSLSTLITYLVNSISERAKSKGLKFKVDLDPSLPRELNGDDARINQVIMNLLTNAVKYTHEGSVTLAINEAERTDDRVKIHVEVRDTGIGIKEEDMSRLFESFERLDVVKNRNIEGTGLGMSITTRLLNLMDSELKVESKYGEGSVFSFDLWQKIEDKRAVGRFRPTSHTSGKKGRYKESFHAPDADILVVDDTKVNLTVAVSLLKKTGIKIDTAISGSEALELAEKKKYDVILMDQRMPGMDGTQTLKRIRELENGMNRETPVICLTADAIRGARERYMEEGFSDYLTKPVEGSELERMLLKYLPEGKVTLNSEHSVPVQNTDESPDELIKALENTGVDTGKGLAYCQNDAGIYREVLIEYAAEYDGRKAAFKDYFDKRDWENYLIIAHSLKSTSGTLGAFGLSEIAAGLEKAAGDKNETVIFRDHPKAMAMYDMIAAAIKENTGASASGRREASATVSKSESGFEILEFSPIKENNMDTH